MKLVWTKNRYNLDNQGRDRLYGTEVFLSYLTKVSKVNPSDFVLGLYNAFYSSEFLNKEKLEVRLIEDLKSYKVDHLWTQLKQYA